MRTALAIVVLLTACATEPLPGVGHVAPGIAKQDLIGVWSHRAVVVSADPATGVSAGEERRSDIEFEIQEHDLVARALDGDADVLVMRVAAHFDVERRLHPATGETTAVLRQSEDAPWYERAQMRLDVSMQLVVDPMFVPLPGDAEPLEYIDELTGEVTWLPATDAAGRVTWSFLAHYQAPGGLVVIRHELARIGD